MPNEDIVSRITDEINRDRGILEALKSGNLHFGEGPKLRGDGDRTKAQIIDLERKIADNEKLLETYRA